MVVYLGYLYLALTAPNHRRKDGFNMPQISAFSLPYLTMSLNTSPHLFWNV